MIKKIISVMVLASVITLSNSPAKAHGDIGEPIMGTLGVAFGVPVGSVMGGLRGFYNQGAYFSDDWSERLGGNVPAKLIAYPLGISVGGSVGLISGVVRGMVDGVNHGYNDPFSEASMSIEGNWMDYDPLEINI